jgi:uncharacterized RDD family membrane protein YckC
MIETAITSSFEYVGFWRRVAVALLDLVIFSPLVLANILWITPWSYRLRTPWPAVVPPVVQLLLMIFLVVRFGGTPAKLVLGMRIVDQAGVYLRVGRALLRDMITLLGSFFYLLVLIHVISSIPPNNVPANSKQRAQAYDRYAGGWYHNLQAGIAWVGIADVLVVSCNRRKRAIHDFMAGSFVITKRSYDEVHAVFPGANAPSIGDVQGGVSRS